MLFRDCTIVSGLTAGNEEEDRPAGFVYHFWVLGDDIRSRLRLGDGLYPESGMEQSVQERFEGTVVFEDGMAQERCFAEALVLVTV